jgi:hypothetical protein
VVSATDPAAENPNREYTSAATAFLGVRIYSAVTAAARAGPSCDKRARKRGFDGTANHAAAQEKRVDLPSGAVELLQDQNTHQTFVAEPIAKFKPQHQESVILRHAPNIPFGVPPGSEIELVCLLRELCDSGTR